MHIRILLTLNALSCLVFGTIFAFFGSHTGEFLGFDNIVIIRCVGVALLFNGCHLVWAARRAYIRSLEVLYFSSGDFLWVFGTICLVTFGFIELDAHNIYLILLVSAFVGVVGTLQLYSIISQGGKT